MATEQELRLIATGEGAAKAAGDVQKIADAQQKLGDAAAASGVQTAAGTEAFRSLQTILNDLHPGLGRLAGGFLKVLELTNSLGGANLNLRDIFNSVTGALKNMSGSLALLGAGGAVVLSIIAIQKALADMRAESERVTKAIKDQQQALNALKGEEREHEQSIENLRDASRAGPFTADQAWAAADTRRRLQQRPELGFLEGDAINQTLAAVGGASDSDAGGGRFDIDPIARIAALVQQGRVRIDPKQRGQRVEDRLQRALQKFGPQLDAVFGREAVQGGLGALSSGARQESVNVGGSDLDLTSLVKRFARPGQDIQRIVALIQEAGGDVQGLDQANAPRQRTVFDAPHAAPDDLSVARQVIQTIHNRGATQETPPSAVQPDRSNGAAKPTVINNHHYHMQNQRNYGSDARSFRSRATNGETRGDQG